MIGFIPKLLLALVESSAGPEAVAEVKRRAGVAEDRHYRLNEICEDRQWRSLFVAACQTLRLEPAQAEEIFADYFMQDVTRRFPEWFRMCRTAREFLERQPRIHNAFFQGILSPEQREKMRDKFTLEADQQDLIVHYRSDNQLCRLYEILARKVFEHFGERGAVEQERCTHRGDTECVIRIRFLGKAGANDHDSRNSTCDGREVAASRRADR